MEWHFCIVAQYRKSGLSFLFWDLWITHPHTHHSRTYLNEGSVRRRGRYLYNTQQWRKVRTSIPSAWFEPAISEVMRRQTHVFDRMATCVGDGMLRRKTEVLWVGLGPSATLSTTNLVLFHYKCRLIARYFSNPADNFYIYSVLKVHQLVDCLPSDFIDRWYVMSLWPADLTTRSTPSPHADGSPEQLRETLSVISAPPSMSRIAVWFQIQTFGTISGGQNHVTY
jgi:hypothetical protein